MDQRTHGIGGVQPDPSSQQLKVFIVDFTPIVDGFRKIVTPHRSMFTPDLKFMDEYLRNEIDCNAFSCRHSWTVEDDIHGPKFIQRIWGCNMETATMASEYFRCETLNKLRPLSHLDLRSVRISRLGRYTLHFEEVS